MMYTPVNCVGYFTPYHSPVNQASKAGKTRKLINITAEQMRGVALALMKKEDWYLPVQVLLRRIFTVANGKAQTYILIVFWRSMRQRENSNGIFKLFIMTCGIGIMPHIPYWSPLEKTEGMLMP